MALARVRAIEVTEGLLELPSKPNIVLAWTVGEDVERERGVVVGHGLNQGPTPECGTKDRPTLPEGPGQPPQCMHHRED